MHKVKIPKSFLLFGRVVKVILVDLIDDGRSLGETDKTVHEIRLVKPKKGNPLSAVEQTFYHEFFHLVIYETGFRVTEDDEENLVNLMASMTHQMLKTAKY